MAKNTEYLQNSIFVFKHPQILEEYDTTIVKQGDSQDQFVVWIGNGTFDNTSKTTQGDNIISAMTNELSYIIFNDKIPNNLRIEFIKSTYVLFEERFSKYTKTFNMTGHMFWDSLIYMSKEKISDEKNKDILDCLFQTIAKIFTIDNMQCQLAALHGLNHLYDQRCKKVIDEFIARCKNERLIEYAKVAREHKAL